MTTTNDQLSAVLPAHAHQQGGPDGPFFATWTTPAGAWLIQRARHGVRGDLCTRISGPGWVVTAPYEDADRAIAVLRTIGALDQPTAAMAAQEAPEDTARRFAKELGRIHTHIRDVHTNQGAQGNWDFSDYMRGMFNGIELALAIVEDREPQYRDQPSGGYLSDTPLVADHTTAQAEPDATRTIGFVLGVPGYRITVSAQAETETAPTDNDDGIRRALAATLTEFIDVQTRKGYTLSGVSDGEIYGMRHAVDFLLGRIGPLSPIDPGADADKLVHDREDPDTLDAPSKRIRNTHCVNCGDTRGGPIGHETSECTWNSKADGIETAEQSAAIVDTNLTTTGSEGLQAGGIVPAPTQVVIHTQELTPMWGQSAAVRAAGLGKDRY